MMDNKPKRIQRRRTKGYKMPPGTVYVGRPTKWGNPGKNARFYEDWLFDRLLYPAKDHPWVKDIEPRRLEILQTVSSLRGKNLACWCPLDKPCHADVLLEIANRTAYSDPAWDDVVAELARLCEENERLREAIVKTVEENLHFADGDNCTLIHLKRAIKARETT